MKITSTLLFFFAINAVVAQTNCTQLFISEYVEGWSNNKAIEIYNPTSLPIDLSQYFVSRYSNGSSTATVANSIQLSGTIAPHRRSGGWGAQPDRAERCHFFFHRLSHTLMDLLRQI